MGLYCFGIDVGGTSVKCGLFRTDGTLIDKWEIPTRTENNGSEILPDVAKTIEEKIQEKNLDKADIDGVGIGIPGPVNSKGEVACAVNLYWGFKAVAKELSELTGLPAKAGNDANVAALGEYWKGGGQGCENMVFVTLGTGVGGGIVVEGRLLHGAHGSGSEIGHLVLERSETEPCNCGKRGCVEQYCSATGVVRLAKRYLAQHDTPSSLRSLSAMTCKDVFDAGKAGDEAALAILDQFYRYMGEFLGNVCSTVDPEVVVIGGGVSKAGSVLLEGVQPYFHQAVFHAASEVRFALASLGNDAGAYGAFKLALDAFGG